VFPLFLDTFPNPSGSTFLNASGTLKHHVQHENANDAIEAMQSRIGITGSAIPTTIDYELHNIFHGHDHDGVNSRHIGNIPLAAILADCQGPFEGFATGSFTGSFHETTFTGRVFPATRTWYTDTTKSKKIIEKIITRNSNRTPNTVVWNVFEKDGITKRTTVTDTISYVSGGVIGSSRVRIVSSSIVYSVF
jgi:hypothetical protein